MSIESQSSFHRVAAVKIESPLGYINTGLGGTYQRIRFFDDEGVERAEVTVHLTDSATPLPVFDGTLK